MLNRTEEEGQLIQALKNGDILEIEAILDQGINIDELDPESGGTALHLAVSKEREDIVTLLVTRKINLGIQDSSGRTALDIAKQLKYNKIINLLEGSELRFDEEEPPQKRQRNEINSNSNHEVKPTDAMQVTIGTQNENSNDSTVNSSSSSQNITYTSSDIVFKKGELFKIVNAYTELKGWVNDINTSLPKEKIVKLKDLAEKNNNLPMVELLKYKIDNLESNNDNMPIDSTTYDDLVKIVNAAKELRSWIKDNKTILPEVINTTNEFGFTPLHIAAMGINVEMVYLLLKAGANPKEKTTRKPFKVPETVIGNFIKQDLPHLFPTLKEAYNRINLLLTKSVFIKRKETKDLIERSIQNFEEDQREKEELLNKRWPTIVWAMPSSVLYQGSTKRKTVDLTSSFLSIHKQLIHANSIMGKDCPDGQNRVVAHLQFIVLDQTHNKEDGRYQGGRIAIDFPIVQSLSLLNFLSKTPYGSEDKFQNHIKLLERTETQNIGKYYAKENTHSEPNLIAFLRDSKADIVNVLKSKLEMKFKKSDNYKVYGINLFINSDRNVCNRCEEFLARMMDDQQYFLTELRNELIENSFKLPNENNGLPRMFITAASSFPFFDEKNTCTKRLQDQAKNNFDSKDSPKKSGIDVKALSGKIILGIANKWLGEVKNDVDDGKIPFYTGTCSRSGNEYMYLDRFKDTRGQLKYDLPQCHDGINWTTLVATSKSSQVSASKTI